MPNVTFDCTADGTDRTKRDDGSDRPGNWQVIFKVCNEKTGNKVMDYCRETVDGSMSRDVIVHWAELRCHEHRLHGAIIERW